MSPIWKGKAAVTRVGFMVVIKMAVVIIWKQKCVENAES